MKQIFADLKKGEIKLMPQTLDDLWYLNSIIDVGDLIKGKTFRKIKLGGEEDRKANIIKRPVFLAIRAEKVDFDKNALRVSGKITESGEDIPKGDYHTFTIEENSIITIIKEKWLKFQIDKVKEACTEKTSPIIICVHDREEAYFALLKKYGYELLVELKGNVQKKGDTTRIDSNFYGEIISLLKEYDKKYSLDRIILASPAFWKEDLLKCLKEDELRKKVILATCSSVGKNGIDEVIKRPEVKEALKQERIAKETALVEELLGGIEKGGLSAYGMEETKKAVAMGAVTTLLITDNLIHKTREENNYPELEELMRAAERTKADVCIVSSENDAGRKLDGLGGVGAILRFKMMY